MKKTNAGAINCYWPMEAMPVLGKKEAGNAKIILALLFASVAFYPFFLPLLMSFFK